MTLSHFFKAELVRSIGALWVPEPHLFRAVWLRRNFGVGRAGRAQEMMIGSAREMLGSIPQGLPPPWHRVYIARQLHRSTD